jgi:Resolvase, N terminal domain/Recombinase
MLTAARQHEFEVIIAEDSSRLWRNLAEQSPRLAELCDLGIAVVTHDLDTRHESAEIMGAVGGAMASAYRKEIGRRVRRGLEGLARNQKPTGGRAFGYIAATESASGQREINAEQAPIVRSIFEQYAGGWSPRRIAEDLNSKKVPSPGASWNRRVVAHRLGRAVETSQGAPGDTSPHYRQTRTAWADGQCRLEDRPGPALSIFDASRMRRVRREFRRRRQVPVGLQRA